MKDKLLKDGFIPLFEYENKYQDKLLIPMCSRCYRKNNMIAFVFDDHISYMEIESVEINLSTGYRVPKLKQIDNYETKNS
jgi:hypothetical protein